MDCYFSHFKPLKGTKTFHHFEIFEIHSMEIYFHLAVIVILPLQMKMKINQDTLSLSVVNFL